MTTELDPVRLETFASLFSRHRCKTLNREDLWRYFAEAFPDRPHGAEEAQWFSLALEALRERGCIQFPSENGRCWEIRSGIRIPTRVQQLTKPSAKQRKTWRDYPWNSSLSWVADLVRLSEEEERFLSNVNDGLTSGLFTTHAPLKYRSLQLTGSEKRLLELSRGSLFTPGRLTFDLLGCIPDFPPFAWESISDVPRMIVFENSGSFMVARQALRAMDEPPYGLLAFGGGRGFQSSVAYLRSIERPIESLHYVGDLDVPGLEIASAVKKRCIKQDLPRLFPATEVHLAMLKSAACFGRPEGWRAPSAERGAQVNLAELLGFLDEDLREPVQRILVRGNRIPEEVLGPCEMGQAWAT